MQPQFKDLVTSDYKIIGNKYKIQFLYRNTPDIDQLNEYVIDIYEISSGKPIKDTNSDYSELLRAKASELLK